MDAVTATTTGELRVLGPRDLPGLTTLLARDPVAHCFVASRLAASGMDAWRLGGEMWGWLEDGRIVSALYLGANLVPVETTPQARKAFADRARRVGRRCSSIVGPAIETQQLWALLEPWWGPAREVREHQPLMAIDTAPLLAPDPAVRRLRPEELDTVLPACVAMFTEEVGVSPLAGGGAEPYRARVAEMLRRGRAFGRIEDGVVVFKAEVGAVSADACQVQGVWVDPALRGRGLAAPGMAAVVAHAHGLAPVVSL
jgi:predicted GNAT family acetyltransferase